MTRRIIRTAAAALSALALTTGFAATATAAPVAATGETARSITLTAQPGSGASMFTVHKNATGGLTVTALNGAALTSAADAPHLARPQFSPTCVGSGCNGVDPVSQSNCSQGGYVVTGYSLSTSQDAGYGDINLMYQDYCKANWAEADHLAGGVWIEVYNTLGNQVLYQPNYNWGYTSMVNGNNINDGVCIYNAGRTNAYCIAQPGTYPTSVFDFK